MNFELLEAMVNDPRMPTDVIGRMLSTLPDAEKVEIGNYIEEHHGDFTAENHQSWQDVLGGMHEAPAEAGPILHMALEQMVNDNAEWQEIQGLLEAAAQEVEAALPPGEDLPGGGEDGGGGPGIPNPGEPGQIPDLPGEPGGEGGHPMGE